MDQIPADQLHVFGAGSLAVAVSPDKQVVTTFSGPDKLSGNDFGLRVALVLSPDEALSLAQVLQRKARAALAE